MRNNNNPSKILISSEKILDKISDNWKSLTEIQNDLRIEEKWDIRYLKMKLNDLERKNLVDSKNIGENKCFKKVEPITRKKSEETSLDKNILNARKNVQSKIQAKKSTNMLNSSNKDFSQISSDLLSSDKGLEILSENWKSLIETKKVPKLDNKKGKKIFPKEKKKGASLNNQSINKKITNKTDLNYESLILKFNRIQKNIKSYKSVLTKKPNNTHFNDLLKKAKKNLSEIKTQIKNHSFFICLECKRIFKSKEELANHTKFKHSISDWNLSTKYKYQEPALHGCYILDLHGFYLEDAKLEVVLYLTNFEMTGFKGLILIHGYKHGQTLKNYFRSETFIREMRDAGFEIDLINTNNPGSIGVILKN